ncbi:MAG: protein-L-isoaspartate O-methyltransferase [bacterium]
MGFKYHPPKTNEELIDIVERRRNYLGLARFDPRVIEAMRGIDRSLFAPPGKKKVFEDEPFSIGHNQTCSQPSMVAAMATLLRLQPGHKVLEVGAGCGYSAAVTAKLIEPGGTLISIEYIKELTAFSVENLSKISTATTIKLLTGDGSVGYPEEAPYDRIYLTAGVGGKFNPDILLGQLKDGGLLLYPEAFGSLFLHEKSAGKKKPEEFRGVGFVCLRGRNGGYD